MAIEFLLVISMVIVVFLIMLQYAVRAHAERIASAAAEEGVAAAAGYGGTAADGRRVATDYLTRLGPGLTGATVDARRTDTVATVTISGRVEQLIPFLAVDVHTTVEGPIERFAQTSDQSLGVSP